MATAPRKRAGKAEPAHPRTTAPMVLGNYSPTPPLRQEEALSVPEILSCVRVLAEEMASLPLELWVDRGGRRERARWHRLSQLFGHRPNSEMTTYEVILWMMFDACIRSAGYAQIVRAVDGTPLEIWPLLASQVSASRDPDGGLWFSYGEHWLRDDEVLRVQMMPCGGLVGLSLVEAQAKTLGQAQAANDSAGEFLANGSQVSGVLSLPGTLSDEAYERIRRSWAARHEGAGKRARVAVLEGGASFSPTALKADESQMLESRKFNRSTIAGLFRVPAHLINDLNGATFSNIESQELGFYKHTLRPWATNWIQRLNATLLTDAERAEGYSFDFDFDDLLRGDMPSRAAAYGQFINAGVMTVNEARQREGLPDVAGGEINLVQGALRPLNQPAPVQ